MMILFSKSYLKVNMAISVFEDSITISHDYRSCIDISIILDMFRIKRGNWSILGNILDKFMDAMEGKSNAIDIALS